MRNKEMLIAPSILSSDLSNLSKEVQEVKEAGADWIHVDVMDGHFVPNLSFGPQIVRHLKSCTQLPLDVHLMVQNPRDHVDFFVQAGAQSLTLHREVFLDSKELISTLKYIKNQGILSGLAIKPKTPIEDSFPFLKELDILLIMTVEPGFSGQTFIREAALKIPVAREKLQAIDHTAHIQIDGGVNEQNLSLVKEASVLVAGHHIFKSSNYKQTILNMKQFFKQSLDKEL